MITEAVRTRVQETITDRLFIDYGTNEFGEISIAKPDDISQHPGTVGRVYEEVELSIVDDNGNPCQRGEVGNILIKVEGMMNGYIKDDEATKKTFRKEGYYPGDLGRLTEDGNLIFEGRRDDMMIYQGVNIYPREIESTLESHPKIMEAAAFPLYTESEENIPYAVVKKSSPVNEKELLRWCASELGWRTPQRIFFIKELPRNKAGKVLKKVIAQQVIKLISKQKNGA